MEKKIDLSFVLPAYKEGNEVKEFLDDLIREADRTGLTYEILYMDNTGEGNSAEIIKEYSKKYDNFFGYELSHPGVAVIDKSNKYMLGYKLARGKYVFQMDVDGQDRPEELPKFIKKLDEGTDLVVGYKEKRLDSFFYVLSSRFANMVTRAVTGVKIHDMNNGFKGMKADIAKSLILKGGNFRFIPAMLIAKKKKIDEVPAEHRERTYGEAKFNFWSRLKGGMFDMPLTVVVAKMGDTPFYVFGKLAVLTLILGAFSWFGGVYLTLLTEGVYKEMVGMTLQMLSPALTSAAVVSLIVGIAVEYLRLQSPRGDYGVINKYPEDL